MGRSRDRHRDRDRDRDREDLPERKRETSEDRRLEKERRQKEEEKRNAVSRHYRVSRRERDREQRVRDRERDIEKEYHYRIREYERDEEAVTKRIKRAIRDAETVQEPNEREKRRFIERDLAFGRSETDEREWKRHREETASKRSAEKEKDLSDIAAEKKEKEEERRKIEEEEREKRHAEEERKRIEREAEEEERRKRDEEERKKREEEERKVREAEEQKRRKEMDELRKVQEAAAAKLLQSVQEEMRNGDTGMTSLPVRPALVDETDVFAPRKHKPLTRLDGGEAKLRDDEMRRLIQQVPTDKAKAFAFEIDWDSVHEYNIIEKKLRPWVKKKVTEYLGAEEQGMIEFIMRKVTAHTSPDAILAELEGFLDEEAEHFTLKMWRMLIFEVLRVKAR